MRKSKVCFKCGKRKLLSGFYKHLMMADGHLNKCKECTKKDVTIHRNNNLDRIREYDRKRAKDPNRREASAAYSKEWQRKDRRRMKSHNAINRAIRSGKIIRKSCEWPGCNEVRTYAHHESYDYPLDVIFYCQIHHKQRHKQMKLEGVTP